MSYTRKETIDIDFAIRRNRTFFLAILFISRETEWYPSWYKKEEKKYEGSSVLFSSSSSSFSIDTCDILVWARFNSSHPLDSRQNIFTVQ